MKLLGKRTTGASVEACAAQVMEVATAIVRRMRAEIRRARPGNLSLTQIQALGFLEGAPDSPLSSLADLLALRAPSASQLVDGLVRRGLVTRRPGLDDRRQIQLRLTARGERVLKQAFDITRGHLAELLQPLSAGDRAAVTRAMAVLKPMVVPSAA